MKYEAIGTGALYDAVITGERHKGVFFDIEVIVPGCKDRVPLTAVRAERLTLAP